MRYPKIPQKFGDGPVPGGVWVAEEKVHGANLAIVTDGERARAASRRGPLEEEALDAFFGLARIWAELAAGAVAVARGLIRDLEGVAEVVVYGELAGGRYPHPDVPVVDGLVPVQTGVWYAPDLVWLGFDAVVRTSSGVLWLGRAELEERLSGVGLRCVPLLGRGRRNELREPAVEFPTRVPAMLGLPELPGNRAEGYVLKPAGSWASWEKGERPVLKVKHPAFAEDARYNGARPFVPPPGGAAGVAGWLLAEAVDRLTPARVAAGRSKLGPAARPEELAAEVIEDLLTDLADDIGGLSEPDRTRLAAVLLPGARVLIGSA
ncbi:RNA ligase family protein [Thermomonospora cellulosilytica]|uniref:Rnl2 family RNA ligase n=1 Tax=Thermomonospora cellulosilytica TaxID=1411118 RepID=A0A7W3MTK6_9ACTN|nr:RNA ligase family protein [Thermomonospora cellulosilytica]MBA9001612.1 Rnl2 family RNA ligase [Thermomonospora cellulosilytica]